MHMRRLWITAVVPIVSAAVVACGSGEPSVESPPAPLSTVSSSTSPPESALTLRLGDLTQRAVDINADGRNTTAAVAGINAFAVDLYKSLAADQSGNMVVSPYSVTFALGMIYAGARGQTAAEMAAVLHANVPETDWQEGINAYDLTLDARTAGSPTTWSAANKVWTLPGLSLRTEYLDVLTGAYGSPLAEADFAAEPDAQRAVINGWVAGRTKQRVPELFPSGAIDPQTVMVLVNAVALDAPWEFPFDPAATLDEPFTRADGTTVDVAMMHYNEYLPSATTGSYQAVELPYGGGALSMVVIVPTDMAAYEAALTPESLAANIASIQDGGIHLSLPKWTARTHVTLNDTLSALGMGTAFSPAADFSGMVDGGGLAIDRVEDRKSVV